MIWVQALLVWGWEGTSAKPDPCVTILLPVTWRWFCGFQQKSLVRDTFVFEHIKLSTSENLVCNSNAYTIHLNTSFPVTFDSLADVKKGVYRWCRKSWRSPANLCLWRFLSSKAIKSSLVSIIHVYIVKTITCAKTNLNMEITAEMRRDYSWTCCG